MRIKKGDAYLIGIIVIVILSALAVISTPAASRAATIAAIFPGAIIGVVGVTTVFIGGNVADNGVKGKCYNSALDNRGSEQ